MKKILLSVLLIMVLVTLTGCGKKSEDKEKNENTKTEQTTQNEIEVVDDMTYYCTQNDGDDFEVYWYYIDDELVKITETSIYADDDDYAEAKENTKDFKGVKVSRKDGKLYIDMDIKNGGISYYENRFGKGFKTSLDDIAELMTKYDFSCEIEEE